MSISKKVSLISPSVTLAITTKTKQMKQEGIDVVGFGAGEPDFDTPEHIKEIARKSMNEDFIKCTAASGTKKLKEAICRKFKNDTNLDYSLEEVLVFCGAKHFIFNAIFNAILALCNEEDEVILPSFY